MSVSLNFAAVGMYDEVQRRIKLEALAIPSAGLNSDQEILKKIFYIFSILLIRINANAYDCSTVKPFIPSGQQSIKVTISRYIWNQGHADYEDI